MMLLNQQILLSRHARVLQSGITLMIGISFWKCSGFPLKTRGNDDDLDDSSALIKCS
jgi:hypothetical protein